MSFVSLNISGSQTNVLEFNDESPEIKFLNESFVRHLRSICRDDPVLFDAVYINVNVLDKDYSTERFSVLYNMLPESFVLDTNLTFNDFCTAWEAHHNTLANKFGFYFKKSKLDINVVEDHVKMWTVLSGLKTFDWCAVLAFRDLHASVESAFHRKTLGDFHRIMSNALSCQPQMIAGYLQRAQPTAFMFQEACMTNLVEWTETIGMAGYQIVLNESGTTGFFIPTTTQYELISVTPDETKFSEETAAISIEFGGERLTLISSHLSSKNRSKAKCAKNYEDQMVSLINFCQGFPKYVVGSDINHHPSNVVGLIPSENIATTNKERTWVQAQKGKAGVNDQGCKDHFISNLDMKTFAVGMITAGCELTKLPNEVLHPFDHYLIEITV